MKPMLKYVALPFLVLGTVGVAIKFAWDYSPTFVLSVLGSLVVIALVRAFFARRRDMERGWRVGHQGRDSMYYEEMVEGSWERIPISGEMLCGDAHHVIYFPLQKDWDAMPSWTKGRQDEIISRIKADFTQPGYEYEETEKESNLTIKGC